MIKKEILEKLDYIQEKISHFDLKQVQLDLLDVRDYIEKLDKALNIYQEHTELVGIDKYYNEHNWINETDNFITQEEYDLLKELEDEYQSN